MGRFLLILLAALGIAAVVAYSNDWFPFEPEQQRQGIAADNPGQPKVKTDLGDVLYSLPAPSQTPIEDPEGSQRGLPFSDCHFVPIDRQEVSAAKEGVLKFIGEQVDQESPTAAKGLPTVEITVGAFRRELAYRRIKEGDLVKRGQMVALVDPTKALNDIEFQKAKINSSIAEHLAAIAMSKEAQARLNRLDDLKRRDKNLVSAEEYSAAVLTRDKHAQEEVSKREQVKLAEIERDKAIADLRQHEIRCTLPGESKVSKIFRSMGEGIKNLDAVMVLENVSRLRAEGAIGAQYFDRVRVGQRVVLEPTHTAPPETPQKVHRGEINGVAVTPDGLIVSGSEDQTICLWRRHLRLPVRELRHPSAVRSVACSPKSSGQNLCAAGLADGRIWLWKLDVAAGEANYVELAGGHNDAVTALAFSPDGKWLASGGQDNQIVLWDVAARAVKYPFDPEHGVDNPHQGQITALFFTPQGKLVSAARDTTIRVWALHKDGARLEGEPETRRGGTVTSPGVSADGRLFIHDQGRTLQLRTLADRQPVSVLELPSAAGQFETAALFSPDGSLLLTAGAPEGRLQLWRTPSRRVIETPNKKREVRESRAFEVRQFVPRDRAAVSCAAFDPDGQFAVSGSKSGHVYFWNLPTRKEVEEHRIRFDRNGQPLTLSRVDWALDASRLRISVDVDNPEVV